jgi:hypothetical protein
VWYVAAGSATTFMHVDDMAAVNTLIWAYVTTAMVTAYKQGRLAADSGIDDRPVVAVWLMVHRTFLQEVNVMLEPHRAPGLEHIYPLRSSVRWDLHELIDGLRARHIPFVLCYQRLGDAVHVPTGNPHAGV